MFSRSDFLSAAGKLTYAMVAACCVLSFSVANAENASDVGISVAEENDSINFVFHGGEFRLTNGGHGTGVCDASNDRKIYIDVHRGEENDNHDPDGPPYSLDIMIRDNEAQPMIIQSGGGSPANSSWLAELRGKKVKIDSDQRTQDFADLQKCLNALGAGASAMKDLKWGWVAERLVRLMDNLTTDSSQAEDSRSTPKSRAASTTTYKHTVTVKKKKAFDIVFEHSSAIENVYDSKSKLILSSISCNHGTCANDSSMSQSCSASFSRSWLNTTLYDLQCDLGGSIYGLTHVCNNDTAAQVKSVVNGSSGSWSQCSSIYLYAPGCK